MPCQAVCLVLITIYIFRKIQKNVIGLEKGNGYSWELETNFYDETVKEMDIFCLEKRQLQGRMMDMIAFF